MKIIKFRRLNRPTEKIVLTQELMYLAKPGMAVGDTIEIAHWEIAFNEQHLREKLNGDLAEVIMPAESWWVRLWRKFFPIKFVEAEVCKDACKN